MDVLGDISWFTGDGLHPSAYGQVKIAQEVYNRVKDAKW
jgi:lysophospholipase L1-like esterase